MKSFLYITSFVAFGLSAVCASDRAAKTIILDESGVKNLNIRTEWVEERDFEQTLFAIGRIEEIPASHSVLSSRVAGRVTQVHAFEGDTVAAGEPVAVIETRQLGDPPPSVTLHAPQGGLVTQSHIRLGQPVEPDAELMDFSDRSKLWAVAKIPEQAAAKVRVGSLAHIRVPALGDVQIDAKLIRFGVSANRESGTVEAIFEIENESGRLRPGLRAEFSVVTDRIPDVLAVPLESVQGDPTSRVVFVKDFDLENAFVRVPVVLGARSDRYVEVREGLFPGDEVVVNGAYSLMFAGGGQQISLKEALDAAHGHEHNEDGSEMTPEQRAAKKAEANTVAGAAHAHDDSPLSIWLLGYAAFMTVVSVILLQKLLNAKRAA